MKFGVKKESEKRIEAEKKKKPQYTYDKQGTRSGIKSADLSFEATNKTIAEQKKEEEEALRQAALQAETKYRLAPDAAEAAGITEDVLYDDEGNYDWNAVAKNMATDEYQQKLRENFLQKQQAGYDAAPWYQRAAHNVSAFLSDPILVGSQLMEGKGPLTGQMDWLDDPAKAQKLASRFGLTAEDLYDMSGENDSYVNDLFKFINPGHWGTQAGVGIQDASTALDEGRYLDAAGNIGYAGLNLFDAGALAKAAPTIGRGSARMLSNAPKEIDRIIYPKKTWRASSTTGENIDYAADLRTQALAEKIAKQGEFTTSDLGELEFYLRGNTGRRGLLMGDDMTLTEYKVPFWKRNVSENPNVVSLKELQGVPVNKSEYIIPSGGLNKFIYPRKTTLLKAAPEHLTKMDGWSLRTSVPLSKESPMYYSNFAKYLEDQMNAAITPNVRFAKEIPSKVRQAENVSEIPASTSRLISDLKNANIISPTLSEAALAKYPNLLNLATKRGIADKLTVTRSTNPSAVDSDDAGAAMKMGTHIRDEIATSTSGRRNRAGLTHLPTDYDALYHYNKLLEVPVDYGYGSHTTIARYPFDYTGSAQDLFSRYSNLNPKIGKAGEKVLQPVKTIADPEYYTMQKKAFDLNDLWLRSGFGKDKTLIEKELGLNFSSSEDAKQFLRKELFSASEKLIPFKTGKIREVDRPLKTTYYSPLNFKFEEGGYVDMELEEDDINFLNFIGVRTEDI
jgi:hypothetical protein